MRRALAGLTVCLLLTGCMSLPDGGDVRTRRDQEQVEQGEAPFDFDPSGPRPGAAPEEVVEDFLTAMQASPQTKSVALQFLTASARGSWVPENATLVYGARVMTARRGAVRVELEDPVQLDGRGTWLGPTGGEDGIVYKFTLVREKGEWRIDDPPDALIFPRTHFETRYQQYFVYYFDPSAQILVPQPVYLPRGEVAPGLLVRRLLQGPDPDLLGVLRTFVPEGTDLELSVPVSADGVADVPLSDQVLDLSSDDLQMVLAQVAWTLRQVPGIESMRVTVGGSPLDIPGEGSPQSVNAWTEYDPSIHWASQELFGIRGGRIIALAAEDERGVEGQFGAQEYLLREIAVDLPAEQVAGVTEDGTTVVVAPRARDANITPDPQATTVVHRGADLLKPAWDIHGQLWLVDRTSEGAALMVRSAGVFRDVVAPGISGQDVSSFVVSRDGSRLVAVVAGRTGDRLMAARVQRDDSGRVEAVDRAEALPVGPVGVDEIRDIAWRTPGSVAVLTGPTPGSSQVLVSRVDGSSVFDAEEEAETFRERAVRLVASPSPGSPLYIATDKGRLYELAADGQWVAPRVGMLRSPVYVG